jgi:hypothetical protein
LLLLTVLLVAVTFPAPVPKYDDKEIEETMMPGELLGTGVYVRATYYPVNNFRHLTSFNQSSEAFEEVVLSCAPANVSISQRVVVAAIPATSTDDTVTDATSYLTFGSENHTTNYSTTVHVTSDLVDLN